MPKANTYWSSLTSDLRTPTSPLKQLFAVCHLWHAEPSALLPFFLANLLAQHGGVVPAEAQLRIRGMPAEHAKRFSALRIVVEKDVAFFALDEGEHVDVVVHLPRLRSAAAGGVPTVAGD